jgi:MCP family monocarboxylic acid transporter-like MFS transporter 10
LFFQVQYVKDLMPDHNGGTLVTCIAITSGIGRIVFGKVADHPNVNGIALQQLSFISIGICTMLLTAAPFFTVIHFDSNLSSTQ